MQFYKLIRAISPTLAPLTITEVELSRPLHPLQVDPARYQRALVVVRLHDIPLGIVEVPLWHGQAPADEYVATIWQRLGAAINAHLAADGLAERSALTPAGIAGDAPCQRARAQFLATAPPVSVVVATHDRPALLAQCLDSLLALEYPHFEILVVDNAPSSSATHDLVRERYGLAPHLRYLREDRLGVAHAENCGLHAAQTDYIAITDDDVVVDRWWLLELMRGFARGTQVASVTGQVLPRELETPPQFWFEEFASFTKDFTPQIYDLGPHRRAWPTYPFAAGKYGTGANCAFRKELLQRIGGFDPALSSGQDMAVFCQVILLGQQVVYAPAALLYHRHRRDFDELKTQIYGYGLGYTAYLLKMLLDYPRFAPLWLRAVLNGGLAARPTQRPQILADETMAALRELQHLRRQGLRAGPRTYLRARRQVRRERG